MSNKDIKSISDLKAALGVTDIKNTTAEQVETFINMIPAIDREVVIEFVKQLPDSLEATEKITEQFRMLASEGIASSNESNKDAMNAYKTVIDSMAGALKDGEYTFDEQKEIWDKMESVADKMDDKDTENKEYNLKVLKTVGLTLLQGALIVTAFAFGAKLGGKKD